MPNLPDDETLIPKEKWRGARFEKLNIHGTDGSSRTVNECATDVSKCETKKIAKLAPKKASDSQFFFVLLLAVAVAAVVAFVAGRWSV